MISGIKSTNIENVLNDFNDIKAKLSLAAGPAGLSYMHTAVDVFTNRFASICLNTNQGIKQLLKSSKIAKSRRMKKRIVGQTLNAQSMVLLSNHHPQKRTVIYSCYGQRSDNVNRQFHGKKWLI